MAEKKSSAAKKDAAPSRITKMYLISYNLIQLQGWGFCLILILTHLATKQTYVGVWDYVECFLKFFQTLQALEIIHVALGLVKSNLVNNIMQISSRLFVMWGIVHPIVEITNNFSITMMLIAWCIAEITRYSLYATGMMNKTPDFLTWCRYNFFLVLYPMGVSGELLTIFAALPYITDKQLFTLALPNAANFSFQYYYLVILTILSYLPGFPLLFGYMLNHRRKYMSSQKEKKVA